MVFKEIASATNALRAMQGFPFYDKPMVSARKGGEKDVTLYAALAFNYPAAQHSFCSGSTKTREAMPALNVNLLSLRIPEILRIYGYTFCT